jgi:hypothetical protein
MNFTALTAMIYVYLEKSERVDLERVLSLRDFCFVPFLSQWEGNSRDKCY